MNYLKWMPLLGCAAVLSLSSCSDDEGKGISPSTNLTPDEHKVKLEQIGLDVLAKVNPEDHADLLRAMDYFSEIADYGGLEVDRDETVMSMAKLVGYVKSMCRTNNLGMMPQFASPDNELYSLAQCYGIYTYDEAREMWRKSASDNSLEFHFEYLYEPAVIKITASGDETKVYLFEDRSEVEYGGDKIRYEVYVPEHAEAVMTWNGKTLCSLSADMDVDDVSRSATVSSTFEASGYVFKQTTKANKTDASVSLTFDVKGDRVITAKANVKGDNMTDEGAIDDVVNEDSNVQDLFEDANGEINILDEAVVKMSCSNIKSLVDLLDDIDNEYYEYPSYYELEYADKMAAAYNKYMKGDLYYTDGDNSIAKLSMHSCFVEDEYFEDGGYYDYEAVITFASDSSAYSLESYFNDVDFNDLVNSAEDLGDRYESYLRYLLE